MHTRRLTLAIVLLGAAVAAPAAAQDQRGPQPLQAAKTSPPPAKAPARPPSDPTRCHPTEDIACTVVRETPHGTIIVTRRAPGTARPAVWSVVSGPPPEAGAAPLGGTIYVVPATSPPQPHAELPRPGPANGAPILD